MSLSCMLWSLQDRQAKEVPSANTHLPLLPALPGLGQVKVRPRTLLELDCQGLGLGSVADPTHSVHLWVGKDCLHLVGPSEGFCSGPQFLPLQNEEGG